MIMFKAHRISKFKEEIMQICKENSFEFTGDLSKGFTVKTPEKAYRITILSTYRFKNSGITIISDKEVHLWALIPLLKGFGGGISFPLSKTVKLNGICENDNTENVLVVYPKCMSLQVVEHESKNTAWTPGKKVGSLRIFDGASFKDELRKPGLYTEEKQSKHSAVVSAVGC